MKDSPRRVTDWLTVNYPVKGTARSYYQALKLWLIFIYGEDSVSILKDQKFLPHKEKLKVNWEKGINKVDEGIERYFSELDNRDFLDDYKRFINWLRDKGYANLTTRSRARCVKIFFGRQKDPRCKIDDDDWAQIKRTIFPKSTRPQTKDKILTKEQIKLVLSELSVHGRALALFLLSTGARVGESCKLRMMDLHLDEDPPWVDIQEKYTKDQVGGRLMWFSYEARDAIRDWHLVRIMIKKTGFGRKTYLINPEEGEGPEDLVFDYNDIRGFEEHWNKALLKADRGQKPAVLARRDKSTMNNIHIYHVHTLRKFFKTRMSDAGVVEMNVHAWMGHKGYLAEAYDRPDKLAELYKEHMGAVTVHEVEDGIRVDMELADNIGAKSGAFVGLSEEEIEALSLEEKWRLIKIKFAKPKVPVEEIIVDDDISREILDAYKHIRTSETQ